MEFDVRVRANNDNHEMGIYHEKGSFVEVYYKDVMLCSGVWPAFYQPPKNVTVVEKALKGSNVAVRSIDGSSLKLKLKVGSFKTWEIKVQVKCGITVDNLTEQANVVSQSCDYCVNVW